MSETFNSATYLSQVKRLRKLGELALERYPIDVRSIKFINHGENATFKVTSRSGKAYLLRIHRQGYHTPEAIAEELAWLLYLSKNTSLLVPRPVVSKDGNLAEVISTRSVRSSRVCCVFDWIDGQFFRNSARMQDLFQMGELIADLQDQTPPHKSKHRPYWDAMGLVGPKAKFGTLENLRGVSPRQKSILIEARERVFQELCVFEKKHPKRTGLIHADMHFGNVLKVGGQIAAIDFDDCGVGFHAYDLAIPLLSIKIQLGEARASEFLFFREALLAGYDSRKRLDADDENAIETLITARHIMMLAWLNSRNDNPKLEKYMKVMVGRALAHLNSNSRR